MDETVIRAMARWPDVPAVFGWLSLDLRGRWRLKGEPIGNRNATAFIDRNYAVDEHGRWYFQNGPQRVYVTLEYTPWVIRLTGDGRLETHTGLALERPAAAFVDDGGHLLIDCERGVGVVDDRDLDHISGWIVTDHGAADPEWVADVLEGGRASPNTLSLAVDGRRLALSPIARHEVAARFHFDPDPAAE